MRFHYSVKAELLFKQRCENEAGRRNRGCVSVVKDNYGRKVICIIVISIYMKLDDAAYKICRAYLHIYNLCYVLIYNCCSLQRQFFSQVVNDRRRRWGTLTEVHFNEILTRTVLSVTCIFIFVMNVYSQ